ncbi:MAG: sigma 54-interacting transcriptional regulator [Bacillota bacterium]
MIGVLAPYQEIEKIVDDIRVDVRETIKVANARVVDGVIVAKELIRAGAVVLVARGGTSDALRSAGIDIPIVNIPITAYDVLRSVAEARKKAGRICILAFESMIGGLDEVLQLIGDDTSLVTLKEGMNISDTMKEWAAKGETCFVGGAITCEIAHFSGYANVLIRSGKEAVSGAIHEASRIVKVRRAEEQKRVILRSALDSIEDGVVVVDSDCRPELWNSKASLVFGSEDLSSSETFRAFMSDEGLRRLVRDGQSGDAVVRTGSGANIVASVSSPLAGNNSGGAVLSLRDAVRVEALEQKVRGEVHSRGLVAKRRFGDVIGQSEILKKTMSAAQAFAAVDATVLILGESGTGKELYAQAMHNVSSRRNGPYVAVNCAALPESLLESELFGYAPGAFTGATREGKPGLFELAHKGTLLLDEVNELSPSLQGKLLRVLQERVVRRVGGDRVIPVDVRVIACTNRDLVGMMEKHEFREDLFFRLDVLRLYLPPLRERLDDVILLFSFFVKRFSQELSLSPVTLAGCAESMLTRYSWPGNAREVQNVVQRCLALFAGQVITAEKLQTVLSPQARKAEPAVTVEAGAPAPVAEEAGPGRQAKRRQGRPLTTDEIDAAIAAAGGSVGKAASALGVHRSTLWRYLKPR